MPLHLADIISNVSASSVYANDYSNYTPLILYDGNKWTAWIEGVSGAGIGEYIMLHFDDAYAISKFSILTGCHYKKIVPTLKGTTAQVQLLCFSPMEGLNTSSLMIVVTIIKHFPSQNATIQTICT